MKLVEDEQLKNITDEYTAAIDVFVKREYANALAVFEKIIEKYKETEFFSVAEIQTRAKVYRNICRSQIEPISIKLETDEDYINESVFNINAGYYDRAIELLTELENRKYKDLYLNYLFALSYLKKDDVENSLKHLKKCIKKDNYFKIMAYNDVDFSSLLDNKEFRSLVE
ncbi:MAG: hypothetical protein L0Y73_00300 [Candidatus Aminicenantes bacterium]|nr:hypothetical protein [Candidatus Aminicenantes bacterium]